MNRLRATDIAAAPHATLLEPDLPMTVHVIPAQTSGVSPSLLGRGLISKHGVDRRVEVRSLCSRVTARAAHVPLAMFVVLWSPLVPAEATPKGLAGHRDIVLA